MKLELSGVRASCTRCGNRSPAAGPSTRPSSMPAARGDGAAARRDRAAARRAGPRARVWAGQRRDRRGALVGDGGEVVLSDVAPAMTAIAAARAEALGLANVSARVLDLEQIDEPDEAFDVVVCREGLMLVPDPVRAAHELRRVLRPGGRAAVASGDHGNAIRGSASSSTRSAPSSVCRCRRRECPDRSRWTTLGSWRRARRRRTGRRRGHRGADALSRRLGRGVVDANRGARGSAGKEARALAGAGR